MDTMDLSEQKNKCSVLVMDKMHIKEDLVYDKHQESLVEFVNLGETKLSFAI